MPRGKEEKTDRRRFVAFLRSFLPSWRAWIAILVGVGVGLGALAVASQESRTGVRSSQVTIDDPNGFFNEEELRTAIDDVTWGRPIRVLIVVGTTDELQVTEDCQVDNVSCLQDTYPAYFPTVRVDDDAVVLWVEPEREIVNVSMGVHPRYEPEDFWHLRFDVADSLTYRLSQGELTPRTVADGLQVFADQEAEVTSGRTFSDYLLAAVAGLIAGLLVGLVLHAARQRSDQKKNASHLAGLSGGELKEVADRVFDTYREATESLDGMELIGVATTGSYGKTMEARVEQYRHRYIDLARAVFDVQHLDPEELIKPVNLPSLVRLDRIATVVREAEATLQADENVHRSEPTKKSLRRGKSAEDMSLHPSVAALRTAIDAATVLAQETGDKKLAKRLPVLAGELEVASKNASAEGLVGLDAIATELATVADHVYVAYESEHGKEFDRRTDIEDPFRYRTLEIAAAGGTVTKRRTSRRANATRAFEKLTSQKVKQQLAERIAEAKVAQGANSLKIPVSPIVIMIAAAVAMGAGGVYVWLNPVEEGVISDADEAAITIPYELVSSETERNNAVSIPDGDEVLHLPDSVTIIDDANIIDDEEALADALSTIPLLSPADYLVLTTPEELPLDEYEYPDERGLTEIFPEYFEPIGDEYAGLIDEKTVAIWYADSGEQSGFDTSYELSINVDEDSAGRGEFYDAMNATYPSIEAQVWDGFAGYSNGLRGVGFEESESTITSGSSNVTGALVTALITFAAVTALLPLAMRPFVISRRKKGWEKEVKTSLTAMTLAEEALTLEISMVAADHPTYDSSSRLAAWESDYLNLHRLGDGIGEELSIETRVALVRTVREQAESLWRIRPVLGMEGTWAQAWENEGAVLYAALGDNSQEAVEQISALAPKLSAGTITPTKALSALDTIARERSETARLRSLTPSATADLTETEERSEIADSTKTKALAKDQRDDRLAKAEADAHEEMNSLRTADARAVMLQDVRTLADTPVFSLARTDDIGVGVAGAPSVVAGESVQQIHREKDATQAFFSIDTSATRWLRAVFTNISGYFQGYHEKTASEVITSIAAWVIAIVLILSGVQVVNYIIGDGRTRVPVEVRGSSPALSVSYIEDGEPVSDELRNILETRPLGVPIHLLIYTTDGVCNYDTIDGLYTRMDQAPNVIANSYDRGVLMNSSVMICLGPDSGYLHEATDLDSDGLPSAVYEYDFEEGDTHETWLLEWFEQNEDATPYYKDYRVTKEFDENIR